MFSLDPSSRTSSTHGALLDVHHISSPYDGAVQRQHSKSSTSSSSYAGIMATIRDGLTPNRAKATSSVSRNTSTSANSDARPRTAVRTLPPWIHTVEDDGDIISAADTKKGLLSPPSKAHAAEHHHATTQPERRVSEDGFVNVLDNSLHGLHEKRTETGFFGPKEPVRGRKWDHARVGEPVIMQSGIPQQNSPWGTFIRSSMYGPPLSEDTKRVDDEFLRQQTPGYEKPWRGDLESNEDPDSTIAGLLHSKRKRRTLLNRFQNKLLMHPLIPLAFRVTVLTTSVAAIGLATSLHHLSNNYSYAQNPSATMAIAVDCVAIPYILYITWDEYTGKPLGLRSPKAKIRLVLLDLFFIIFESANLALAFAALTEKDGSCTTTLNGSNHVICNRVKALCGILMIALIAWSLTFTISIFRLVERIGNRESED